MVEDKKEFYTFGIQRTCTNLAKEIVLANFDSNWANVNDVGHWSWKHTMESQEVISRIEWNTPVIFCYKNPLMWMESIIRNDVDFINRWGIAKYPDYHDPELLWENSLFKFSIPLAIEKWVEFHLNWMNYCKKPFFVLMNQKKMCSQEGTVEVLNKIHNNLKLKRKSNLWTVFTNNVDYRSIALTDKDFTNRKSRYLENKVSKLSDKQVEYINKKVPKEIIDFFEK